jgi:hypothetical protein
MKTFKVNKNIVGEPKIFGLSLTMFFLFVASLVLSSFLLISNFTLVRVVLAVLIVFLAYVVLYFLDSDYLNRVADDSFPDTVICDRFK